MIYFYRYRLKDIYILIIIQYFFIIVQIVPVLAIG